MRACVAPVCDLKTEVEVITHNGKLKPCWGNVNEVTFKNIRKMPGSKIVQVKGLMPQESDIARKHPPGEPLGEMWYGITFSAVQKFVMLEDNFIGIAM